MIKKLSYLLSFILPFGSTFANSFITPTVGTPHSVNKQKFVEVYGHRGARSFSPENTIPAYRTGLKVGINWADMDIVMTKDAQILVSHDLWLNPNFVKDTNGKYLAKSKEDFLKDIKPSEEDTFLSPYLAYHMTAKQLQQYDVGTLNSDSSYAKLFPDQVPVPGTKMPTLQEVIDYIDKNSDKKVHFQMEIKTDAEHENWSTTPEKFAAVLYKILKDNHIVHRAEIQAFDWRYLYALQKLDKNIKTAYLVGSTDITRMEDMTNPQQAGLWSGGKLLKDYNHSLPQMVKALGGSCYEPEDVSLTKEQLDEAHKLGLKVVVWTWPEHFGKAFDPVVMSRLIDWGVDGIITDDPARLNAMLAARGYPVPKNYAAE
jgi:glycerophosphoryl diester phosphodiesterase